VQVILDVLNSKPMQTGSLQECFDYSVVDSETAAFLGPNSWSIIYYNTALWKPTLLMTSGVEMSLFGGLHRFSYPMTDEFKKNEMFQHLPLLGFHLLPFLQGDLIL
jgi:hypothetical protein